MPVSPIRWTDGDNLHFASGVIDPPNDGMETQNGNLPVAFFRTADHKVRFLSKMGAQGFDPSQQ